MLGDDDPAEVQAGTEDAVRQRLAEAGPNLRRRPAAGEWSVLELAGHLVDAEIVMSARYRWAISHDRPTLPGYDQDLWVARLRHNDDDPEALVSLFAALRRANLRLWQKSSAAERAQVALHAERGPETYEMMFRMIGGHDRFHLNQMRRTLNDVGER